MPQRHANPSWSHLITPSTLWCIDHRNLTVRSEPRNSVIWASLRRQCLNWLESSPTRKKGNKIHSRECNHACSLKETPNCHLGKMYDHYKRLNFSEKCVIHMKNMAGLPFQSNKLNKLLMIKQIENVRRYTKCWKEFSAAVMNGAAH